jgi:hypothetical protein
MKLQSSWLNFNGTAKIIAVKPNRKTKCHVIMSSFPFCFYSIKRKQKFHRNSAQLEMFAIVALCVTLCQIKSGFPVHYSRHDLITLNQCLRNQKNLKNKTRPLSTNTLFSRLICVARTNTLFSRLIWVARTNTLFSQLIWVARTNTLFSRLIWVARALTPYFLGWYV